METSIVETVERFYQRFTGLARGHGKHTPGTAPDAKGKIEGRSITIHEPYTIELWSRHLAGTYSLGIIPIRDDGTACFGAIDVDEYNLDLYALATEVERLQLPLILCRTKSGGAHLFFFTSEPAPAALIRGKLMEWAIVLGHAGVEVFPKQTRLAGENDWGSWINMPYFGGENTERYAIAGMRHLTPVEFLDLADLMAMSPESLKSFETPYSDAYKDILEDAPPCLQCLAQRGIEQGTRNLVLYQLSVYVTKRFGAEQVGDKIDSYNQRLFEPPLGHNEVTKMVKQFGRGKNYQYKCQDAPFASVCNKQICITRRYGVGQDAGDPGVVLGGLIKVETDPPSWIWEVDGARIALTTDQLQDQRRFHSACINTLNKWPIAIKTNEWMNLIRTKLEHVEVQKVGEDARPEGLMWAYLEQFVLSGSHMGRSKDELLMDKAFIENGRTYFKLGPFLRYLQQQRVTITQQKVVLWLKDRGAEHHFFNLRGRGTNVWSIPSFAMQTEDFDVPQLKDDEEPL